MFVDDGEDRRQSHFVGLWIGATFFYTDLPTGEDTHEVYLDTLDGLWGLRLPRREIEDVRAVYQEWGQPWMVYDLMLKKNGRELDPAYFDPTERKKFNESDSA